MKPAGYGMPYWLDTDTYLTAEEARVLPEHRFSSGSGTCMRCGKPPGPPVYRLEGAHVVRKGMGGRTGGEGYQVELCHDCHQGPRGVDRRQDATMAVRRDNRMPVWLEWDGQRITEHGLGKGWERCR